MGSHFLLQGIFPTQGLNLDLLHCRHIHYHLSHQGSPEYTEELYKRDLHNPDNDDGVITHLEPDILECEVKWALGSVTTNKASGGNWIPVELFQILKDDAMKVLHSICQQIWKTQQWPQDWKWSVFIPIPKKGNPKECSNYRTITLISLTSKVKVKVRSLSGIRLFPTPWTAAYQAPLSMGFSRQSYWSEVPLLSPLLACEMSAIVW